jgi:hypothetical protein
VKPLNAQDFRLLGILELRRGNPQIPELLILASSGLSTLIKDHFADGASWLAALQLPQILLVFSVVAPWHPGAALRDLVLVQRGQAFKLSVRNGH